MIEIITRTSTDFAQPRLNINGDGEDCKIKGLVK